jgi:ParB family chromosome partitioning protein
MFEKEMNSIREFGFIDPITVRPLSAELYEIIDGDHSWKAARRLGMTAVPCTIVNGLSDQQAKKLTPILNGLRGEPDALSRHRRPR